MKSVQDRVMACVERMDEAYEAYAKANGLTYLSLCILTEIVEEGNDCTQKRISEVTRYPKQTVNLIVKSFLENGWVELRETAENRKLKRITLTQAGQAFCARVVKPLLQKEALAMTEMGEEKSEEMGRLLEEYCIRYCESVAPEYKCEIENIKLQK